jgi:hypothetical protein
MGRKRLRWLCALALALAGCHSTTPDLKPPSRPEEVVLPPPDDMRFCSPPSLPKDVMEKSNGGTKSAPSFPGQDGPKMPRMGMNPGLGGY